MPIDRQTNCILELVSTLVHCWKSTTTLKVMNLIKIGLPATLTIPHPTRPMTSCYVIHCREHIFRLITSQNDIKYISRQVTKHADHAPNTCNSLIVCQGCCACHCKRLIPITLGLTKRGSWSLTSSDFGHRETHFLWVLHIAIFCCLGPPSAMAFEQPVRNTCGSCCCSSACSQAMKPKLRLIVSKLA